MAEKFEQLYQRAAERKGGKEALEALLVIKYGDMTDASSLSQLSDDRVLSAFTRQIFKSGFVWHP